MAPLHMCTEYLEVELASWRWSFELSSSSLISATSLAKELVEQSLRPEGGAGAPSAPMWLRH